MTVEKTAGKVDAGPDPSPTCPRCNHFARTQRRRDDRIKANPWPPLDQNKVDAILRAAFPRSHRS